MPDTEFAPDALDVTQRPQNVDDAREAIAQTRERISATLDAIELRIDETKDDLRRKVDVLRPVRERIGAAPWTALGIAAGAGLALGLLTGGSDDQKRTRARSRRHRHERARATSHGPDVGDWIERGERALQRGGREMGDWIERGEHALERGERTVAHRGEELLSSLRGDGRDQPRARKDRYERQHRDQGKNSLQERLVDHLLQALAGAISDGISTRFRRKMID